METRTDTLCDILSSFEANTIPSEFKERYVDDPAPDLSPVSDSSLVLGSLPATIYRLACRDDAFYRCLQEIVPSDVRATEYYQTQNARAQNALGRLSQYADTDPSTQDRSMDVPGCARLLRHIVHSVCEDRNTRKAIAPPSLLVLRRLAEVLARLVVQVVQWNRDIYERSSWDNSQPSNEHPRERNLFTYLIGDPPVDPELPHWMTDKFVIDRLRAFPPSEWSHLLELFITIKDGIEEMDMNLVRIPIFLNLCPTAYRGPRPTLENLLL